MCKCTDLSCLNKSNYPDKWILTTIGRQIVFVLTQTWKNELHELRRVQLFFLDFPPDFTIFLPILGP